MLAEWYFEQRLVDRRFYLLLCRGVENPPEIGALFPTSYGASKPAIEEDDPESDLLKFQQITAALTPYSK